MPYSPDYDRLWQEGRALAAEEAAASAGLVGASMSPREHVAAAAALLSLRTRLSLLFAGIADGQDGKPGPWQAGPSAPLPGQAALSERIAVLEQRLRGLREAMVAPY